MNTQAFYIITMPVSVAKVLQKLKGDKGDPNDFIFKYPTPDFSHESYDLFLYKQGFFQVLLELVFSEKITPAQFNEIRIYEAIERGGIEIGRTLCKNQDFRDCVMGGF